MGESGQSIRVIKAYLNNDNDIHQHFHVVEVRGQESISRLFEFEVVVELSEAGAILESDVLNLGAQLELADADTGDVLHTIYGMIVEMRDLMTSGLFPRLVFRFVPRAFPASAYETLDIFVDSTLNDVLQAVLERSGLADGEQFSLGELGSYPEQEFIVQYKETNLDFVQRLCEHLGIFYFFDLDGTMVFGEDNAAFTEVDRVGEVPFFEAEGERPADCVYAMDIRTRNLPAKYICRDYNWRTPGQDVQGESPVLEGGIGQIVEYGGHFKTKEDGDALAAIRAEELLATRQVFSGESNVPNLRAGSTFMLVGHPIGDQELLVTKVEHHYGPQQGRERYANRFEAILKERPYRPPRLTPKPTIRGSLTGIVQGGSGTEFGEIDELGRYRVKFMFDTRHDATEAQASRAVRMAQPSAGPNQGMHFPLRANTEVIVTFMDGDPDRPIIHGAVPNPQTSSPATAANHHQNMIQTSQNAIAIDDKDARIKLSSTAYGTELQLGSPNEPNEGYALKTMNDGVTMANKAIGSASKLVNISSSIANTLANKNVIAVAGPPDPLSGWAEAINFGNALIDMTTSMVDVGTSVMDFNENQRKYDKEKADKAKKDLEKELLGDEKYPDPPPTRTVQTADGPLTVVETEAQWKSRRAREKANDEQRAQLDAASQAASTSKSELEAYKKRTEDTKKLAARIKGAGKLAKGAQDAAKGAKKLWGDMHRQVESVSKLKEMVTVESYVVAATAVEYGRHNHRPMPALQPINIQGSSHSTAIYGDNNLVLGSTVNSTLYAPKVGVHGTSLATLNSNLKGEVAAPSLYLTSTRIMDAESERDIKVVSGNKTHIQAKDKMGIIAKKKMTVKCLDEEIHMQSKGKFTIEVSDAGFVSKAKDYKVEAKDSKFELKTKTDVDVKASGKIKMVASNKTEFEGTDSQVTARFKGGGGAGMRAKSGEAKLYVGSNAHMKLKTTSAEIKAGGTVKCSPGGVTVNGSSVKLG
jgi:type VI secretion system VgrG family protein